jgi:hypothetical protein
MRLLSSKAPGAALPSSYGGVACRRAQQTLGRLPPDERATWARRQRTVTRARSKISGVVKNLAALPRTAFTGHPRLAEVARLLSALKSVLHRSARRAVLTDISAIEKLVADRASMDLGAFVQVIAGATARSGRTRLALRGCATTWSLNASANSHQHGHGQELPLWPRR